MDYGQLRLDFDGRSITGEKPFLRLDGGSRDDLRGALNEAARRFPDGGALGFFSYEAAHEWEPRAFSRPPAQSLVPSFRLVFYQKLNFVAHPNNIIWRRKPLLVRELPDLPEARDFYCSGVETIKNLIASGDIYQANLTYGFETSTRFRPATIYGRLSDILPFGPAPRGALLEWDDIAIVSDSPETFLTLQNKRLESHPIKGTMRRGQNKIEDENLKQQLAQSEKNRAENVMIVDLLRNDLGRVCEFGSIHVPQLYKIETYPTLHHGVSIVHGRLNEDCDALDAFIAAFPCGSITGAPKIRAMQILSELEPVPRGVSMGAIGYFGFGGETISSMEWSVAIRTATIRDKTASFHVGGGIVADSEAEDEYAEMQLKARALWSALSK